MSVQALHTLTFPEIKPGNGRNQHRPYGKRGRHVRRGRRAAVLRAFTAAKLVLSGTVSSVIEAAVCCGSNCAYTKAALILLKAEATTLIAEVLAGQKALLAAAEEMRAVAALVDAHRQATPTDLATYGVTISPAAIWDSVIVPALR
jgi:hypothetical protein